MRGATAGRPAAGLDFDFIIVGGGVTAAAMASRFLARGLSTPGRVAVIAGAGAAAPAPPADTDWDLRVFALSRASQRVLEICGAWRLLPTERKFAYERMCVWDAQGTPGGAGSLAFDCADLAEPNLGFIVEGRALHAACRRAAGAAGVAFIEAAVADIVAGGDAVRLRLDDGRELRGALLIAADGAESTTRRLLGIETAGHAYHQDALVAHVRTERPHRNTAWQRFLPTGPLAFLPLPDGRSSIVWSVLRPQAARLRAMDRASFADALTKSSGAFLGGCELTTPLASFPLQLQYALDYVRPRAVLVGDAAHAVHPLAGQGLNLGFLDCAALADVLQGAERGPGSRETSVGDARLLRRYERWRRSENLLAASALDALERLFASENPLVAQARIRGLNAVARVPFVKRHLAARALGVSGDIPAFLARDPEPRSDSGAY